jgi:hypothetical protein
MGIILHNTDINGAGFYLTRESVPLCQNKSDYDLHNFSGEELPNYYHMKDGANITELEYCLQVTHEHEFKWDDRDFTVTLDMIDNFVHTFYKGSDSDALSELDYGCEAWQERGERNGFVLYNLWCSDNGGNFSAHHYYQYD